MLVKTHIQHCRLSKVADLCEKTQNKFADCQRAYCHGVSSSSMFLLVGAVPDSSPPCSQTQHSMLHQVLDWALGLPASQRSLYPSAAVNQPISGCLTQCSRPHNHTISRKCILCISSVDNCTQVGTRPHQGVGRSQLTAYTGRMSYAATRRNWSQNCGWPWCEEVCTALKSNECAQMPN